LKLLAFVESVARHAALNCEHCLENGQLVDGTRLAVVSRNESDGGDKKMNARINEATVSGLARNDEQTGEALQRAQYAMLNELPGVVFGFLTIAWIVTSLFSLV
jgi:hypothetical protein